MSPEPETRTGQGAYTFAEIESQPEAWSATLESLEQSTAELGRMALAASDEVVFIGCGSTYYLALAAATQFQEVTGTPARGLPASELWLRPSAYLSRKRNTALIVISRSGATTETLRAVATFREHAAGAVITLSCYPEGELARRGDLNIVLSAGQERSIAQTRAFSVLYLATVFLAHEVAGSSRAGLQELPAVGRRLIEGHASLAVSSGRDLNIERFYLLGSGHRYGLAAELSLKLKEMTLSHSEPFHFLEFRHGPQSMVNDKTLIIGLLSEAQGASERAVLREMRTRGASILSLAEGDADVNFASGVSENLRGPLYLPVIQRLAFERAIAKGLDPDRPQNLEAVVMLE